MGILVEHCLIVKLSCQVKSVVLNLVSLMAQDHFHACRMIVHRSITNVYKYKKFADLVLNLVYTCTE